MNIADKYEIRDRRYTSAEKESLRSGDIKNAIAVCRGRHSLSGIYSAFCRMKGTVPEKGGIPETLHRLCVKLGILTAGDRPSYLAGKKLAAKQKEIVNYLASLPNAANLREKHWLDTPELWAFVDFDRITDPWGDSCGNLKVELQKRMDSWCDRWIPYSSVARSGIRNRLDSVYIFPFRDELENASGLPRTRKRYIEEASRLAESQAVHRPDKGKTGKADAYRVLELYRRMSIGYISFTCCMPVAEVVRILDSEQIGWRRNSMDFLKSVSNTESRNSMKKGELKIMGTQKNTEGFENGIRLPEDQCRVRK